MQLSLALSLFGFLKGFLQFIKPLEHPVHQAARAFAAALSEEASGALDLPFPVQSL
jgi:hypothetical protein